MRACDISPGVTASLPGSRQTLWGTLGLKAPRPLLVPYLWIAEITSGLRRAVWESILTSEEAEQVLIQALQLPVTFVPDHQLAPAALAWAHRLNQKRAQDAFYIAPAEAHRAESWSADRRLVHALRQQGYGWAHWVGEANEGKAHPAGL